MRLDIEMGGVLSKAEAAQLPPLTLAYMGDSVFDMYVRTHLVLKNGGKAGALHLMSVKVVNAKSQAVFAHTIEGGLDEQERNIFMRGRNAKSATVPKNMSVADYRYATAAEAVIGYLYLTGQQERMNELLDKLDIEYANKRD